MTVVSTARIKTIFWGTNSPCIRETHWIIHVTSEPINLPLLSENMASSKKQCRDGWRIKTYRKIKSLVKIWERKTTSLVFKTLLFNWDHDDSTQLKLALWTGVQWLVRFWTMGWSCYIIISIAIDRSDWEEKRERTTVCSCYNKRKWQS